MSKGSVVLVLLVGLGDIAFGVSRLMGGDWGAVMYADFALGVPLVLGCTYVLSQRVRDDL
jgi:hypothetical protein